MAAVHAASGFIHGRLALTLILLAVLLGLLGTYQFLRHRAVGGGFRAGYLVLAALTLVQCLAGLVQLATGGGLHDGLHIVYGIFAVVFIPGVFVYAGRGDRTREAAFLAMACWIVLIAFFRGEATGT